jgi:hypothetical protein
MSLSEQQERDFAAGGWQFGCVLTTDHVWDAFVLLTLLDYNERQQSCLQVPHTGDHIRKKPDGLVVPGSLSSWGSLVDKSPRQ